MGSAAGAVDEVTRVRLPLQPKRASNHLVGAAAQQPTKVAALSFAGEWLTDDAYFSLSPPGQYPN